MAPAYPRIALSDTRQSECSGQFANSTEREIAVSRDFTEPSLDKGKNRYERYYIVVRDSESNYGFEHRLVRQGFPVFRRDVSSCGGVTPSEATPAQVRRPAGAGPADGPRAWYDVQSSNHRFSYYSSVQTGAHASVGVTGGRQNVGKTNRQATGASDEAAMVSQPDHFSCGRVGTSARREGNGPVRMMRTLPFEFEV